MQDAIITLRQRVLDLVKANEQEQECTFQSSLRDILTEIHHIAWENDIDMDELNEGANEVFEEEISMFVEISLDDGGVLEAPTVEDRAIRRRDIHGNCEEIRNPGDPNYQEWFNLFIV
jgi:hypothetical protein